MTLQRMARPTSIEVEELPVLELQVQFSVLFRTLNAVNTSACKEMLEFAIQLTHQTLRTFQLIISN